VQNEGTKSLKEWLAEYRVGWFKRNPAERAAQIARTRSRRGS